MKLFVTFGAVAALELVPVTPPPTCPDLDKNEICSSSCAQELNSCKEDCDTDVTNCLTRCDAIALQCTTDCPCNEGCPAGCSQCQDHPACDSGVDEYIMILNPYSAPYGDVFLIELAQDKVHVGSVNYNLNFYDMEDSCYAFMKGEHWFLGGYYNPHMIAKLSLDSCSIWPEQDVLEVTHIDGVWGSCAVYNDVTHMCFDEESTGFTKCQTFDGENQLLLDEESNEEHDWAAMTVYSDKMWVVGGCSGETNRCHNFVESFDGTKWTHDLAHNFPVPEISGHVLVADSLGMYSLSGRPFNLSQDVYMFNGFEWRLLGKMTEHQAGATYFTSAKVVDGGFAYGGEDTLEKITLSEENFSSVNLGESPLGDVYDLYYAAMILVDGPVCGSAVLF